MKNTSIKKVSLLILLATATIAGCSQPKPLFIKTDQQGAIPPKVDSLFLQTVNIIFDVASLRSGNNKSFRIFLPGVTEQVVIERTKQTVAEKMGGFSWYGQIRNQPESFVLFTAVDNAVSGYIRTDSKKVYQIDYLGNKVHQIAEVNLRLYRADNFNYPFAVADESRSENAIDETCCDTSGIVDVLVVYTTQAKNMAGGKSVMATRILQCIDITNESFEKSNIKPRIELVNSVEVNYPDEGYVIRDLDRMTKQGDGFLDIIHTLRNSNNADVVVLIIGARLTSDLGSANVMTQRSATFKDSAFCVVDFAASVSRLIFPHELGHVLGAGHECEAGRVGRLGLFNESHCYSNGTFGTIMTVQLALPKIERWSNPSVVYPLPGGVPTGNLSTNCPSNNAATIDSTWEFVSKFRCRQRCGGNGSFRTNGSETTNQPASSTTGASTDSRSSLETSTASTSHSRVATRNVWLIALVIIILLAFVFLIFGRRRKRKKNDIVT